MKVAILQTEFEHLHSGNWASVWTEYCENNGVVFEVVNPLCTDFLSKINCFDVVLWHFGQYKWQEMLVARSILFSLKAMGKQVFPDYNEAWHFDDKLAEGYLLSSIKAPIPQFFPYYSLEALISGSGRDFQFPIVAKLRGGSGSHNVKLIRSEQELLVYGKKMFGKGIDPSPSLTYKAKGNIQSAKSLNVFFKRLKRVPEFLRTLRGAKEFPNEKGYVLLQQFVDNDGYDIKVAVVGDKLSFICRGIRSNDFRASGGGDCFYDKSLMTPNIIESAFATADRLGFQCMGFDYVVDKQTGKGLIVEISYGFSHTALLDASGYYDRAGVWHDEPLNAPEELLKNMLRK